MKIAQIAVKGLFGRFDHDLRFEKADPVTILVGPNGSGKAMILRMMNTLFN